MHHVRYMLVCDAESLSIELGIQIHLNSSFRVLGIEIALLCLTEVSSLKVELGLIHEDLGYTFRVELSSDLQCGVPVLLMLIHVDCLLGFVCLYELLFCLLKTIFIFEVKGELQMDLRKLVLSMAISKSECLLKLFLVGLKIDRSFNQPIFEEELCALLSPHILSDFDSDLCKLFSGSIGLRYSECLLPHIVGAIHVYTIVPCARFYVVMLGLLQITLHL